jgi:alanine dehydrogenase
VLESDLDPGAVEPFGDVVTGTAGRDDPGDVLVVLSVGSAVFDAAAAEHLHERAVERDAGTTLPL